MLTEEVQDEVALAWSCHHEEQNWNNELQVSIISLVPLLKDQSRYVTTTKDAMDKIKDTTEFFNPGRTPVTAADHESLCPTLQDCKLLAKLSNGDVVAQEFKYHTCCLVLLYNREGGHLNKVASQCRASNSVDPHVHR